MSNKGIPQTALAKLKQANANTLDRTIWLSKVEDYINQLEKNSFPSITKCALYCGVSSKALLAYELRTPENSEVRILLEHIRDMQKAYLEENGLNKLLDSKITTLLLKANHGLKEEPTTLTQNNTFNVSPEILAEAIEISRSKK